MGKSKNREEHCRLFKKNGTTRISSKDAFISILTIIIELKVHIFRCCIKLTGFNYIEFSCMVGGFSISSDF